NLRESRSGAKRANIVVVTKCPSNLKESEQENIRRKLKLKASQELYFTYIDYDDCIYSKKEKLVVAEVKDEQKLLLAGIAKPAPFFKFLKSNG
ncbi:tetraacyldisaccharide 4'-kinase, partial [Acinetobacter baumannii]|nr:tetraacyldisaccharide 4'-kinase [Acinetobacter baumannii]